MNTIYLRRDYGLGETYVTREVEDRHMPFYQYEQRTINCKKCKQWKNKTILCSNGQFSKFSEMFCPGCVDRRTEAYIAAAPKSVGFATKNIPSWRLDMEGATPEDILNRSEGDFNIPYKSHREWQEYYQQPHELKRQAEFEKQRREESDQLLRSLG